MGGSMHLSDFSVASLGETSIVGSGPLVARSLAPLAGYLSKPTALS
jgi:hypothetical protein